LNVGNPFNWIAEKLQPVVREQPAKVDKKKFAEKGQLGLFETVPTSVAPSGGDVLVTKPKKKFTEVRALSLTKFVQSMNNLGVFL
jgi:hypothetical protein